MRPSRDNACFRASEYSARISRAFPQDEATRLLSGGIGADLADLEEIAYSTLGAIEDLKCDTANRPEALQALETIWQQFVVHGALHIESLSQYLTDFLADGADDTRAP